VISPDAYTPRHLAEKILTSKSALEGERKQVTVLFADLKGSGHYKDPVLVKGNCTGRFEANRSGPVEDRAAITAIDLPHLRGGHRLICDPL